MVQYYPENTWDAVDIVDSPRFHRLHAKQPAPQHGPRRRSKSYYHDQPPSPLMPPSRQHPYYFEDEQDMYEPPLNYWDETLPDDYMEDDYNDYTAPPGPHWSPFPTRLQPPRRRSLASHYQPEDHYAWYDDDNDNARPVRRRSFTTKRRFASPRMDYSDDDDESYHSRRHPHRTPRIMGSPEASPVRHAPMEPINTLPTTPFYGQAPFPMPQPMMPSSFLPYFPTIPPAMPFHPMMMPAPPPPPPAEKPASPPQPENTQSPASVPDASPKKENALVPLARSLSLQTSSKPRRSLFGLFGTPKAPTLIPVQDLTKDSLTRKQSLSLEKKAKALAQRSYIWCYRIKPSLTHPSDSAWVAMVPRNQTKLDPYMVFYQPDAVVKGLIRTETLPTLVTLEKEPKLTGSITVMPQAKIARVYPSMFSSSNYMELIIDCLPADSQFVVRSD